MLADGFTFWLIWRVLTYIVVGAIFLSPILVPLVIWLNYLRKSSIRRWAQQNYRKTTHHPDGTPLPSHSLGVCTQCQRADYCVYHLPPDRRLCPACYHAAEGYKHAKAPTDAPEPPAGTKPPPKPRNPETAPTIRKHKP
jgi:hypothetical protein